MDFLPFSTALRLPQTFITAPHFFQQLFILSHFHDENGKLEPSYRDKGTNTKSILAQTQGRTQKKRHNAPNALSQGDSSFTLGFELEQDSLLLLDIAVDHGRWRSHEILVAPLHKKTINFPPHLAGKSFYDGHDYQCNTSFSNQRPSM